MPPPLLHIALVWPEIPQNTGNIGRLCLGVGARLHLVHPLGFQTDEKAVRRAGLDYWKHVDVMEHADLAAFDAWRVDRPTHFFSSHGEAPYTRIPFADEDVLVFGRESVGLPPALTAGGSWSIPMTGPIRSLNLANAVSVVVYGALQRLRPGLFA
jgi:tRNA (cytidine/uridine-2'-O-)-methyltransferase